MGIFGKKSRLSQLLGSRVSRKLTSKQKEILEKLDDFELEILADKNVEGVKKVADLLINDDKYIKDVIRYRPFYNAADVDNQIKFLKRKETMFPNASTLINSITLDSRSIDSNGFIIASKNINGTNKGNIEITLESRYNQNSMKATIEGSQITSPGRYEITIDKANDRFWANASFREDAPSIIPNTPAIVRGGIPLTNYINILQAKALGYNLNRLKSVAQDQIINLETRLELAMLKKRYPQKSYSELFIHTTAYDARRTFVKSIGKQINDVQVSNNSPMIEVSKEFGGISDEILRKYGLSQESMIIKEIEEVVYQLN